jgi:hypothetical protein
MYESKGAFGFVFCFGFVSFWLTGICWLQLQGEVPEI